MNRTSCECLDTHRGSAEVTTIYESSRRVVIAVEIYLLLPSNQFDFGDTIPNIYRILSFFVCDVTQRGVIGRRILTRQTLSSPLFDSIH